MYLSHINVTMPKHSEAIARMFFVRDPFGIRIEIHAPGGQRV